MLYNNMFYFSKKLETRVKRRNGDISDRSLQQNSSSSKNHLIQTNEKTTSKDLAQTSQSGCKLKQRNKIEEKVSQPFPNFIFGKHHYESDLVTKHFRCMHQGLLYSSLVLGTPSQGYLKNKMFRLPQPSNNQGKKPKILMLDLDETLIHTVKDHEEAEVQVNSASGRIRFNVRPFCQVFLETVSKSFQVYVFTSAVESYAKAIVDYLNSKNKYILGFLHRSHCLQTKRGLRIKDLRIIQNRDLSQIVIVDNLVHSFGLQLENGIPILEFTHQKEDKQLLGLAKILREVESAEDVREYLSKKFQLKKCINYSQEAFLKLNYQSFFFLKERKTIG